MNLTVIVLPEDLIMSIIVEISSTNERPSISDRCANVVTRHPLAILYPPGMDLTIIVLPQDIIGPIVIEVP